MESVIFYGAGRNAQEKFDIWERKGLIPVCFSDADITKHHKSFMGLLILPLAEVLEQYPDYVFYCTQVPGSLYEVRTFLLSVGIPENRIRFCEEAGNYLSHLSPFISGLYPQMYHLYQAMQDELSRKWFWGRMAYCCSHSLTEIYRTMICREHLEWVSGKQTYGMQRYGLHALWDLLKENYPVQRHKIWLLVFDEEWNKYAWVVERFLDAMPGLGIKIAGCVMSDADTVSETFNGVSCITEKDFLNQIDRTPE